MFTVEKWDLQEDVVVADLGAAETAAAVADLVVVVAAAAFLLAMKDPLLKS